MSKLQLQVGDVFYLKSRNEVRIVTNIYSDRVQYEAYTLVDGKWELFFYNDLELNTFLFLFGEFKVPKLKAIMLKHLIKE